MKPPAPQLVVAPQNFAAVMTAMNRIQILAETLSETQLDPMQVELLGALIDSGMELRRLLLGASAMESADPEDDVVYLDDDFELGATGLHEEDFRDFEEDLFLYEETLQYAPPPPRPLEDCEDSLLEVLDAEPDAITKDNGDYASGGPLRGLRVMLVDENPVQLTAVCNLLRDLGAEAQLIASEFAAQAVKHGAYDAALVDMQSTARIGLSLIRVLRVASDMRHDRAVIMAILPNATPEQIRDCLSAGADGWLPRPPNRANLLEQLEVLAIEKSFDRDAA
jgi:CheY-like chemotaxis protein